MDVEIVENGNAENCVHIIIPGPPEGHLELSDEERSNAAASLWLETCRQRLEMELLLFH
jgi:hypothetical protein